MSLPFDITQVFNFGGKLLDVLFPDPKEKAAAKALLIQAESDGKLKELSATMQVMMMEAQSKDKWTSRARPSFMYVMYIMILASIPMGILTAVSPDTALAIISGVGSWLRAIPGQMWGLFGVGYLGYVGARGYDKKKLLDSLTVGMGK